MFFFPHFLVMNRRSAEFTFDKDLVPFSMSNFPPFFCFVLICNFSATPSDRRLSFFSLLVSFFLGPVSGRTFTRSVLSLLKARPFLPLLVFRIFSCFSSFRYRIVFGFFFCLPATGWEGKHPRGGPRDGPPPFPLSLVTFFFTGAILGYARSVLG